MLGLLIAIIVVFFLGENVFSIQMSGMVQALGVTTLVVSLGLQDLIKSVVAGMLIVASDIVSVGDQVIMGRVTSPLDVLHTLSGSYDLVIDRA